MGLKNCFHLFRIGYTVINIFSKDGIQRILFNYPEYKTFYVYWFHGKELYKFVHLSGIECIVMPIGKGLVSIYVFNYLKDISLLC